MNTILNKFDVFYLKFKKLREKYSTLILLIDMFIDSYVKLIEKRKQKKILKVKELTLGLSFNEKTRLNK